jgi:hypothetical protein
MRELLRFEYAIWQLRYSPINLNELYIALEKYPIKDIAKLLIYGFTSGFNMNYPVPRLPLNTKQMCFIVSCGGI